MVNRVPAVGLQHYIVYNATRAHIIYSSIDAAAA